MCPSARQCRRTLHKLQSDASPAVSEIDGRIEEKRVLAAVSGQIHIADEAIRRERAHVTETSSKDALVATWNVVGPRPCEEIVERIVAQRRIDAIFHVRHR